jgi:hypothetical protein
LPDVERLDALVCWARMLARWNASDDPAERLAIVEAVSSRVADVAASSALEVATRLGAPLTLRDDGGRLLGSPEAPWSAVFAHAAYRHAATVTERTPAELVRLAIDAETRRLFGLAL